LIGTGDTIQTGGSKGSNVYIVIGTPPSKGVVGMQPTNVTPSSSGTGGIFYGLAGITANPPSSKLTSQNASLIFNNTGSGGATAITLSGSDTITADPPSAPAAAAIAGQVRSDLVSNFNLGQIQSQAGTSGFAQQSGLALTPINALTTIAASGLLNSASASADVVPAITSGLGASNVNQSYSSVQSALSVDEIVSTTSGSVTSSNTSATATPATATRTLYGAATRFDLPVQSVYVGRDDDKAASSIDAALVGTGCDIGIDGAKHVEMGGWTGPDTAAFKLRKGNVVVAAGKDMVIDTAFGKVHVAANAVALVMALPTGTAVYNLDDSGKDSVVISIGDKQLSLAPGRQAMITSHLVDGFEMVNPAESFGYRNITRNKVGGGLQAFTSDFSMINAMANVKQLKALIASKHPQARRVAGHMLKTAAILSQISGNGGQYMQYPHPRMTALAINK
jgi:hypothetical protein